MGLKNDTLFATVLVASMAFGTGGCLRDDCPSAATESKGDKGRVGYRFEHSALQCAFGCGAEEPLAEGAQTIVILEGFNDLPPFTVQSDAPDVAEFTQHDEYGSKVIAEAKGPGKAKIELREEGSGKLIDRLPIEVREVDDIEVTSPDYEDRLVMAVGGSVEVHLDLLDAQGCELIGTGAADYELRGSIDPDSVTLLDAILDALFEELFTGGLQEYVRIESTAVGSGEILVSAAGGVSTEIPIDIVAADAATRVELESAGDDPVVASNYGIHAKGFVADEQLYGSSCVWSLEPSDGPVTIAGQQSLGLTLRASAPASVSVTCAIGGASDTLTVRFD